jgi:DNA-binding NtrC family response regulator
MAKAGTFREDLLYRLNVIPLVLPPLRARPGDVEPLAQHFLRALGPASGRPGAQLSTEASAALARHSWPGNVRQLQNFLERLVVLAPSDTLTAQDVERELGRSDLGQGTAAQPPSDSLDARRKDAEREALEEALAKANGNRSLAARLLGVSRRTLYNKLEVLGLG